MTKSLGGKSYFIVMVDDYLRYYWVAFLREKSEAFEEFKTICKKIQVESELSIKRIQSDHGGELENSRFQKFCDEHRIKHEFSIPHDTPNVMGWWKGRTKSCKTWQG